MLWDLVLGRLEIGAQYLVDLALLGGGAYLALAFAGVALIRYAGMVIFAAGVIYGAILFGEWRGRAICHDEHLQGQIDQQKRELKIWDASETAAQKSDEDLDQKTEQTEKLGAAFVKKISIRPICALTADDLAGLRSIR